MKHILCVMLSFLLFISLVGCSEETIYFDKELKEAEEYEKLATSHFPVTLRAYEPQTLSAVSFSVLEDGSFSGTYSANDYFEKGEGYPGGTIYSCNFAGEFANYEIINDYTIKMFCFNLKSTDKGELESIDESTGIRYLSAPPAGLENSETGFTLYTPEAPISALPSEIMSKIPYGTSGNLGVYILMNNETKDVFSSADISFDSIYY